MANQAGGEHRENEFSICPERRYEVKSLNGLCG